MSGEGVTLSLMNVLRWRRARASAEAAERAGVRGLSGGSQKRKNPTFVGWGIGVKHEEPDDYLLSHGSSALSSAWSRFTVLFGMGRGGTNSLWSSGMTCCRVVSLGKRHNQSGKK